MNYYLVIIDTSIAPARGFSKAIQNFYICLAPDEKSAKNMILYTFRHNPQIIQSLDLAISVVSLETITKLLKPNQALWSYVPMSGMRAPGQQKRIPSPESLVNPAAFDIKNPDPLPGPPIPDVRFVDHKHGVPSQAVGNEGLSAIAPPKPIVYEEQVKRDEAIYAKKQPVTAADPLAAVLSDPAQLERLRAFLTGAALPPPDQTKANEDKAEAAMRFSDENAPYDDALDSPIAPPVPSIDTITKKDINAVPASTKPDALTMQRLRANITPLGPIVD